MAEQSKIANTVTRSISATLCALFAFFVVNVSLSLAKPTIGDPIDFPYHGWTYWSLNAIKNMDPSRTNVVLLGSSLVVTAIAECDATLKNKELDLCYYRSAEYFDSQMRKHFGRQYSTMDLSVPGQIPSDAYLTMRAAMGNGIKPGVVVYGLAPRDFIDHTLKESCDTEPFRYLSHMVDISDCASDVFTNPTSQLDWFLQKRLYLYGAAPHFVASTRNSIAAFLQPTLYAMTTFNRQQVMHLSITKIDPQFPSFNIDPGTRTALPAHSPGITLDNVEDYKNRYSQPDEIKYSAQMRFLDRLIALCQSNEIELILVNMPISKRNMDLLQPAWRQRYFADINRLCALHSIPFLDQCDFDRYQASDFRDTVHLNAFGAKKFIDLLVQRMASDPVPARSVLSAGIPVKRAVAERTAERESGIH